MVLLHEKPLNVIARLLGCPRMTQLLKCYAPDAFSGAKFQVFLENGHEIDVG